MGQSQLGTRIFHGSRLSPSDWLVSGPLVQSITCECLDHLSQAVIKAMQCAKAHTMGRNDAVSAMQHAGDSISRASFANM